MLHHIDVGCYPLLCHWGAHNAGLSFYKFNFQEGREEYELWSRAELGLICVTFCAFYFPEAVAPLCKENGSANTSGLPWLMRPRVHSTLAHIAHLRVLLLPLYLKGKVHVKGYLHVMCDHHLHCWPQASVWLLSLIRVCFIGLTVDSGKVYRESYKVFAFHLKENILKKNY